MPTEQVEGAVGLVHHTTPLAGETERAAVRDAERSAVAAAAPGRRDQRARAGPIGGASSVCAGRITVMRPGVPDVPRSEGSGGDDCTVLAVGALVPRKGHDVLLRALARLFDLPWRLVIAGDAERDPALRRCLAGAGGGGRDRGPGALRRRPGRGGAGGRVAAGRHVRAGDAVGGLQRARGRGAAPRACRSR